MRLSDGGVVRAVLDWCAVFASRGHYVTLMTGDPTDVPREWTSSDRTRVPRVVALLPPRGALGLLPTDALDAARVTLSGCDVLHLHAPWLTSNLQLARLARHRRVPYVVTVHGMLDDWSMATRTLKKRLYLALAGRRFLERAAAVHCTAQAEMRQASKWFDHPRTVVLPLLMDLEPFRAPPGPDLARATFPALNSDVPKLLFLSRLHPKKGIEILIDATRLLLNRGKPMHAFIAGTGDADYEQFLRRRVADAQLDSHVTFLGQVTGPAKLSLYQAADAFVLPTSQENFGLVLTEAMACGTPVITTKGVDIWEELHSAGAQIIERTPEALARAASDFLADPIAARERGGRGREWVFKALDANATARSYEALYATARSR
ncbi:MAG: glycosyltransferase [Tepidisphaeraceae bacterium]